jgi:hypothetical protein
MIIDVIAEADVVADAVAVVVVADIVVEAACRAFQTKMHLNSIKSMICVHRIYLLLPRA